MLKRLFSRIWALSVKEFIHLRNDWWLPAFMLFGGALELVLVGWATSRPITNLPLVVIDYDHSNKSRQFIFALENTGTFDLQEQVLDYAVLIPGMEKGDYYAAVVIPKGYASEIDDFYGQPTIQVLLNGAESTPATEALRAIEGVVRDIGEKIALERVGIQREDLSGFEPSIRMWFNESLSEALYTTPAELALMLEFTTLLFAALAFSRERELGTLEQLLVMPYSTLEIIIGKSIPVVLICMADFTLMLSLVHFAFDVPVRGSLLLLFILAFGYLLVELSKGLAISVISRTQHQAFLLVMLIGMGDFMFTGYAAPVESMPPAMRFIANFIPAHQWLNILRGILVKGAGIDVLWPSIAILAAIGLVISSLSLAFVRRALNY